MEKFNNRSNSYCGKPVLQRVFGHLLRTTSREDILSLRNSQVNYDIYSGLVCLSQPGSRKASYSQDVDKSPESWLLSRNVWRRACVYAWLCIFAECEESGTEFPLKTRLSHKQRARYMKQHKVWRNKDVNIASTWKTFEGNILPGMPASGTSLEG